METDIELPADYKMYSYHQVGRHDLCRVLDYNHLKSMNYINKYNNGIIHTQRVAFSKHQWLYYPNGLLQTYDKMNSHYLYYYNNGEIYEYDRGTYEKNGNRQKIVWDACGNEVERKKYINGVKVE